MRLPAPRHWVLGLALSLLVAWLAGAIFLDTVQPMVFDPQLGRHVAAPGTTSRTRAEGWASSSVGQHGIRGLPGGQLPDGPKVVFWGDSFVEGAQVDDPQRMAQVFSALAAKEGLELTGVGIGTGADSLIDAIVKARASSTWLKEARLHVFVMARATDTLPDIERPCRASLLSKPTLHIRQADCPPSATALALAGTFRNLELAGAFAAYKRVQSLTLRLRPGPPAQAAPAAEAGAEAGAASGEAQRFLVAQAMAAAQGNPLVFLHLPILPQIREGTIVLENPAPALTTDLARTCREDGAGFIEMAPAFAGHFQSTGRFPFGFFNSPPGSGHLNQDGHRLVAQAVLRYIQEHPDALLAR